MTTGYLIIFIEKSTNILIKRKAPERLVAKGVSWASPLNIFLRYFSASDVNMLIVFRF